MKTTNVAMLAPPLLKPWLPWALAVGLSAAASAAAAEDGSLPSARLPDQPAPGIRFEVADDSARAELTLYERRGVNPALGPGGSTDSGEFVPLCHAPCELKLPRGMHAFGVAPPGGAVVRLRRELAVSRGDTLRVSYHSRIGLRIGGWALLLGGAAAGSALLAAGGGDSPRTGLLVSGAVVSVLGVVGGLWLANLPDTASGSVTH
jgi:hypothetical protein